MRFKLSQVATRLAEFSDVGEVAAQFAILGIRGERFSCHRCPIAVLIHGACMGRSIPRVSHVEMRLGSVSVPISPVAERFVDLFDSGDFPQLVAEDAI